MVDSYGATIQTSIAGIPCGSDARDSMLSMVMALQDPLYANNESLWESRACNDAINQTMCSVTTISLKPYVGSPSKRFRGPLHSSAPLLGTPERSRSCVEASVTTNARLGRAT